jgi:Hom_end-associated Hint
MQGEEMNFKGLFGKTGCLLGWATLAMVSTEAWGAGKYTTPHNGTLMADSVYMTQLFEKTAGKQGLQTMKIDLADPAQYRFVINRLLASGNTPDNSPYLFSRIESMKQKDLARQKGDMSISSSAKKCGHLMDMQKNNNGANADIHSNPQVSCFNGADYTYADIYAYRSTTDGLNRTLLASNSGEEYGGGRNFTDVGVDVSVPMDAGYKLTLDSMVMAIDDAGEEFTSYGLADTVIITPKVTFTVSHPQDRLITPENTIRSCLERGTTVGNLDCDYASVVRDPTTGAITPFYGSATSNTPTGVAAVKLPAGTTWAADPALYWTPTDVNGTSVAYNGSKLYVALQGSVAVNDPTCVITGFDNNTTAVLVVKQAGGTCATYNTNSELVANNFRAALTPLGNNSVPFNLLGDFGPDCLSYLTDQVGSYWQDVELAFKVRAQIKCGGNNAPTQPMYALGRKNLFLDFRNSCIAEGTSVLKADGSEAPIESIHVGDKVMANASGRALTVTSVSRGRESKKMVRLGDDKGRQVMLTVKHPVVTNEGVVLSAQQVKVGDQLLTRNGTTTVKSVEHVPYEGQVYNLELGTSEELAKLSSKDRTLIANGFLVGDSQMQAELEVKMSAKPASGDILARLPKALHQDYKNDLARKQTLKN